MRYSDTWMKTVKIHNCNYKKRKKTKQLTHDLDAHMYIYYSTRRARQNYTNALKF